MNEYIIENGILVKYIGSEPDVVVPDGVVEIADDAFCDIDMHSLHLPGSLKKAGNGWQGNPFASCKQLKTLYISDGQEYAEIYFKGCTSLQEVRLPQTMTTLSGDMFRDCNSIVSIELPKNLKNITDGAFSGCTALKEIHIPDSVTMINKMAFSGCVSLERVYLGKQVSIIWNRAFEKCESLIEFVVDKENENFSAVDGLLCSKDGKTVKHAPTGIKGMYTVPSGITDIGSSAFSECIFMEGISFPDTVTYISHSAFDNCTALVYIDIPETVKEIHGAFGKHYTFQNPKSFESIKVAIGAGEISNNPGFYFPAEKAPIFHPEMPFACIADKDEKKRAAIGYCLNPEKYSEAYSKDYLTFAKKQKKYILQYAEGQEYQNAVESFYSDLDSKPADKKPKTKVSKDDAPPKSSRSTGPKMTIAELKKLWTYAKGGYDKSMTGTETITGVVIKKYKGTEEQVQIPAYIGSSPVVGIESFAFSENNTVTSVIIPETVFGIEDSAFSDCKNLKSVTIQSTAIRMGSHVFSGCESLFEFNIHISRIKAGIHPFWGCTKLMDKDGFVVIGDDSYKVLCDYLNFNTDSNITVPDGIVRIDGHAFAARHHYYDNRDNRISASIKSVTLPDGLKEIGKNAFANVENLTEVKIPEGVVSIEQMAFDGCIMLRSIYLPSSLTEIGPMAIPHTQELTIYTPARSFAESFASKNNFRVEHI